MLKKVDHIGIAVEDMDRTLKLYKGIYGLEAIKTVTLKEAKLKIAFIPLGEVLIEFLQPTEPGEGRIGQFLKEKGEGLHHIALRVENIDRALEALRKMEVPLRDKEARDGGDGARIAFIEPTATQNVLTELVERKRELTEK